jgi:hypothetical protein
MGSRNNCSIPTVPDHFKKIYHSNVVEWLNTSSLNGNFNRLPVFLAVLAVL